MQHYMQYMEAILQRLYSVAATEPDLKSYSLHMAVA